MTPPEEYDAVALLPDPEVREIVTNGDLRLFNVTGHGDKLRELLLDVMAAQRDRLLIASGGSGGGSKTGRSSGMATARKR